MDENTTRRIVDTRHADTAWSWQVAPGAPVCSVTGLVNCAERSCELHWQDAPVRLPVGTRVDVLLPAGDGPDIRYGGTVTGHPFTTKPGRHTVTFPDGQFVHADGSQLRTARLGSVMYGPVPSRIYAAMLASMTTAERDSYEDDMACMSLITAGRPAPAEFATTHDAHMRAAYAEPWEQVPTDDPATGDALTGTFGRTYAESGWLAMQAARDLFGPFTGHTPILLFQATTTDGRPYLHGAMGGCVLTHVDTYDTWDGALRAMRAYIIRTLCACAHDVRPCGECQSMIDEGWARDTSKVDPNRYLD